MWLKNKDGADGGRRSGRGKWTDLVDNSMEEVKPELSSVWVVLEPLWTPLRKVSLSGSFYLLYLNNTLKSKKILSYCICECMCVCVFYTVQSLPCMPYWETRVSVFGIDGS